MEKVRFISGELGHNVNLREDGEVGQYLSRCVQVFGVETKNHTFDRVEVHRDNLGMTHLRLQQKYRKIPVQGGELIIHADQSNTITSINGKVIPNFTIDIHPSISANRALKIALSDIGPAEYRWLNTAQEKIIKDRFKDGNKTWRPKPELFISPTNGDYENGKYRLAWRMKISVTEVSVSPSNDSRVAPANARGPGGFDSPVPGSWASGDLFIYQFCRIQIEQGAPHCFIESCGFRGKSDISDDQRSQRVDATLCYQAVSYRIEEVPALIFTMDGVHENLIDVLEKNVRVFPAVRFVGPYPDKCPSFK